MRDRGGARERFLFEDGGITGHSGDNNMHIQGPKFYPSWAPELGSRARDGEERLILRGAPLVRGSEGGQLIASETRVMVKQDTAMPKQKPKSRHVDTYIGYKASKFH